MSDADARSDIEGEFKEAKETARVYLRAVGVIGPRPVGTPEYREREERNMRDTILRGWTLDTVETNDPSAGDAAMLGLRCVQRGGDTGILDLLRERARGHPAYGQALKIVACRLIELGSDIPDWLRVWEPGRDGGKKRWRGERARQHLIGMVVEAMATGSDVLVLYPKSERTLVQLKYDLRAVAKAARKPLSKLSAEYALEELNKMRARQWRTWNKGKGFTKGDLVALTGKCLPGPPASIDAIGIGPDVEVTRHFPNLHATHNDATEDKDGAYSICKAVSDVLIEARQGGSSNRNVLRAWLDYRDPP